MVANIKFFGTEVTGTENNTLECFFSEDTNEIYIFLEDMESGFPYQCISLNKATAAAFVKKLKFEISKIEEVGNERI